MKSGLSKEMFSDEGKLIWDIRTYYICDQQNRSYKRGGLSRGWPLNQGKTWYRIFTILDYSNSQLVIPHPLIVTFFQAPLSIRFLL